MLEHLLPLHGEAQGCFGREPQYVGRRAAWWRSACSESFSSFFLKRHDHVQIINLEKYVSLAHTRLSIRAKPMIASALQLSNVSQFHPVRQRVGK